MHRFPPNKHILPLSKRDLIPSLPTRNPITTKRRSKTQANDDSSPSLPKLQGFSQGRVQTEIQTQLILQVRPEPKRSFSLQRRVAEQFLVSQSHSSSESQEIDWDDQSFGDLLSFKTKLKQEQSLNKKLIGRQVIRQYHTQFKPYLRQDRTLQDSLLLQIRGSAVDKVIRLFDGLLILAKNRLLIKFLGEQGMLLAQGLNLNAKYLQKLFNFLQEDQFFSAVSLAKNNLKQLCFPLGWINRVLALDLQHNKLSSQVLTLSKAFKSSCSLSMLNLEGNCISDQTGKDLIEDLLQCKYLQVLKLSKNLMAQQSVRSLSKLISSQIQLKQLYLHWNRFDQESGLHLFRSLKLNRSLRVLDLSWNSLGGGKAKNRQFLASWITLTLIVHLDISYCQFDFHQVQVISSSLKLNRNIIGLHFEGHSASLNSQGFLIPDLSAKKYPVPTDPKNFRNRILGVQRNSLSSKSCWVCGNFRPLQITLSSLQIEEQCYIHLDFDNYQAIALKKDQSVGFLITRMAPPQEQVHFFLSMGPKYTFVVQELKKREGSLLFEVRYGERVKDCMQVKFFNLVSNGAKSNLFQKDYQYKGIVRPRQPTPPVCIKSRLVKVRRDNLYPSITPLQLQPYQPPQLKEGLDRLLVEQCVEYDMSQTRVAQLVGESMHKRVLDLILQHFKDFESVYSYICCRSQTNGEFGLKIYEIIPLFTQLKIINSVLTPALCQLKYIATLSEKLTQATNRALSQYRQMFRGQFIEFLVRVCEQRWKEGWFEGLEKVLRRFKTVSGNCQRETWRAAKMNNEEINHVLVCHRVFLKKLFLKYATRNKDSSKLAIDFHSFHSIFKLTSLLRNKELEKQVAINFYLSKQVTVKEGAQKTRLCKSEFVQALTRLAEILPVKPIYQQLSVLKQKQHLARIPLAIKLQNLLYAIYASHPHLKRSRTSFLFKKGLFSVLTGTLIGMVKQREVIQIGGKAWVNEFKGGELRVREVQRRRLEEHEKYLQQLQSEENYQFIQIDDF